MATSSEDLVASDAMEDSEPKVSEDFNCTLCLKIFRSPRRLPCSHSFCQDCLHSHISQSASAKGSVKEFCCPVCGTVVRSREEVSVDKWVYFFPYNIILLSVLIQLKVKVDLVCDVCQVQNVQNPAKELCIVCEQTLCENCSKMHRSMRMSNSHDILKIDDLPNKQEMVLQQSAMFKCMEHVNNPLDLYCKNHEIQLCSKCFVSHHRSCSDVVDLINETSNISDILNDLKVQIKELEDRFKRVIDIHVTNLEKLESQINYLTQEIRALKKSINNALDDLERRVKTECEKVYSEERCKLEQLNLGCQSQIMSIRNSNFIINSVSTFATQTQMFLMAKRLLRQLSFSKTQMEEKCTENSILKLELEVNPQIRTISSIPRGEIGKMKITRNDENSIIPAGFKSLKGCKVEAVDVIQIKVHGDKIPWHVDLKYISHDFVMLLDQNNNLCQLLDPLFNSVSFFRFSGRPSRVCAAGHSEIAVSMYDAQLIQFLSVKDNTIIPTRKITTRHKCSGIATVSQEEMIVSGPCGDEMKYYWSLITLDGKENSYHEFNGKGIGGTCVALNTFKTSLYISVRYDDSLHCFGLDGNKYFTFKHQDLKGPHAVTIDRDDNVYVVGCLSDNIFQLSADGVLIQTITNVVPKKPRGICFNEDADRLLLTCFEEKDLNIFRLVSTED